VSEKVGCVQVEQHWCPKITNVRGGLRSH
jgi:hypothetical protein